MNKIKEPIDAMNLGMGLLPDDRKAEGIIGDLSIRENIALAVQAKAGIFKRIPMQNSTNLQMSILSFLISRQLQLIHQSSLFQVVTSRKLFLRDGFLHILNT